MKFMGSWKLATGDQAEAARRFLAGGAPAPDGVTILGRWHGMGSKVGFVLFETDDLTALSSHTVKWGDVLDLTVVPVLEDADAGAAMAQDIAARD